MLSWPPRIQYCSVAFRAYFAIILYISVLRGVGWSGVGWGVGGGGGGGGSLNKVA